MKIVILDGYTANPGDLSWKGLEALGEGRYMVHADAPIHGVAPGQFCVIYDDRHYRCYGSGEIEYST